MMKKITLDIEGMHCNSCASSIEMMLKTQKGVKKAEVSFKTKKAKIEVELKEIKISDSIKKIGQLGYKVKKVI